MRSSKLAILLITAILVGCSGAGAINPVSLVDTSPSILNSCLIEDQYPGRINWGFWNISIDATGNAQIATDRGLALHFNTVRFMEETPCIDCLTISNLQFYTNNEISIDLTLRHPFPGLPQFTGFDVRGIVITTADYSFPEAGLQAAWELDSLLLRNFDGYTNLFNPVDFPEGSNNAALTYIDGKLTNGNDLSSTLNPFIAFSEDAPRRIFNAGDEQTEQVRLRVASLPIIFGYSVDSNWFPVDPPISDPVTDFPPGANCLEAYEVRPVINNELPSEVWGNMPVQVYISDHQGLETIGQVVIEAPEIFNGTRTLDYIETTASSSFIFETIIQNELEASPGYYPMLIRIEDIETDPNLGNVDALNIGSILVKNGWAQTWGGSWSTFGDETETDGDGNVYVSGTFSDTVDFDPSIDMEEHTSNGYTDLYVTKFNASGGHDWAATWGSSSYDKPCLFTPSDSDGVYVAGRFLDSIDLDPGPGTDVHTSSAASIDNYLFKLDTNGNYLWGVSWGNGTEDSVNGIDTDNEGNVYLAGSFWGSIDLDPGPNVDEYVSEGNTDAYMVKFDAHGNLVWALTWGSGGYDTADDLLVDDSGNIYVHGDIQYTVDLDPGPGTDEVHAGQGGVYLSKLDTSGNYYWNSEWFKNHSAPCQKMAFDSHGNILFTGGYIGFLSQTWLFVRKMDDSGNGLWEVSWGIPQPKKGDGLCVDDDGNIYVTGIFTGLVDLDPGPGFDEHDANGSVDSYLIKLDPSGNYIWGRALEYSMSSTIPGIGPDVAAFQNSLFVSGTFRGTCDLDPGPGKDHHTSDDQYSAYLTRFNLNGEW